MSKNISTYVVIFAGGTGTRMTGASKPKQFLELGGKPIIAHTLQHFLDNEGVKGICIACLKNSIEELKSILERFGIEKKVVAIVPGGATGQDSIYEGLKGLREAVDPQDEDVVLVHDGVRPLIDKDTISRCINSVIENGPTATVAPSTETVVITNNGRVTEVVERSKCMLARAPQGFRYGMLMRAHEKAIKEGFHDSIDSISLVNRYEESEIYTVRGPEENIKITTIRDFFTFKSFVDMKEIDQVWEKED